MLQFWCIFKKKLKILKEIEKNQANRVKQLSDFSKRFSAMNHLFYKFLIDLLRKKNLSDWYNSKKYKRYTQTFIKAWYSSYLLFTWNTIYIPKLKKRIVISFYHAFKI